MARSAGGPPKGRSGSGIHSRSNPARERVQYMLVVATNGDLETFSRTIYNQLHAGMSSRGGSFNLPEEDLLKYIVTAIKVRIEFVTSRTAPGYRDLGNAPTGLRVTEGWALPTPVHDLLSSLGKVSLDGGDTTIVPVWDGSANDLVLPLAERDRITLILRSVFSALGITYQTDISRDEEGRHAVMVLTYLPSLEEWWSDVPIDQRDAHNAMLLGMRPVHGVARGTGGAEYMFVDTEQLAAVLSQYPLLVPRYTIERDTVVRFDSEAARVA